MGVIVHCQLVVPEVIDVKGIIVTPIFQNWEVLVGCGVVFVDTISRFEVIGGNLQQISINVVDSVDTNTVKVRVSIVGSNRAKVHQVVQPVQLFGLHDGVWVIHVVSQQQFVAALWIINCIILCIGLVRWGAVE